MNCPNDNSELRMTERNGVEVDYCARCRGVWLDRGELDKILDRSSAIEEEWRRPHDHRDTYDAPKHSSSKRRRKSFLNEFFDF